MTLIRKCLLLALAAALLGLASCSAEDAGTAEISSPYASEVEYVISVSEMLETSENGRALVDLWMPDYGYQVEPGVEHAVVDVICPSGRNMTLDQWTEELGIPSALAENGLFVYSSGAAGTDVHKRVPPCDEANGCVLEKEQDGTWSCICPF